MKGVFQVFSMNVEAVPNTGLDFLYKIDSLVTEN